MSLRGMFQAFNESRRAARERATLAVTGNSARAAELVSLLGAQGGARGAEILLNVPQDGPAVLSGKAVENSGDLPLSSVDEAAVRRELAPRIVRALNEDYLVSFGRAYPLFRRAVCERVVRNNARQNAVVGALPIPGADMPVMTANQARMVLNISAVYGEDMTLDRARELGGVLAAGFGLRTLARQAVKFVPFGGWAAAAVIGYAGTAAMGRASILYFERGGQNLGVEETARIRERALKDAREFVARRRNRG